MTSLVCRAAAIAGAVALAVGIGAPEAAADVEARYQAALRDLDPGQVLILEFRADWCGPCRYLDRRVFPDSRVRKALEKVSFLRVDTESPGGERLGQRYDVRALPTFLIVDREGKEVERHKGISVARTPERFIEFLRATRNPDAVERELVAAANLGTPEAAWRLAQWYEARGNLEGALRYYEETARRDPDDTGAVGGRATWEAARLKRARDLRAAIVAEALDFARRFPGHSRATSSLVLAAYSGLTTASELSPLIQAHLHALGRLQELEAVAYLSLRVGAVAQARAAAIKLAQVHPHRVQRFSVYADVLTVEGSFRAARSQAAICEDKVVKEDRAACQELVRRLAAKQPSELARYLEDRARLFFLNLESPGSAGDRDRSDLLQAARMFETGEQSGMRAYLDFMKNLRSSFARTGAECGAKSADLHEVWARVELGEAGGRPERVVVLEPGIGDGLRRCIEKSLRSQRFPPPPERSDGRYTHPIHFPGGGGTLARRADQVSEPARIRNLVVLARVDRGNVNRYLAGGRYHRVLAQRRDVSPTLLLQGAAGAGSGRSFAFEAAAMLGFAAFTGPAVIGIYAGGGASGVGDRLPGSTYLPIELSVAVDGDWIGSLAWVRAHFLMSAEERRRGARNGPGDELALGFGLRISLGLEQELLVGASLEETLDGSAKGLWTATRF